ncbi:MAG: T9SS type A sorting domain-containing protein [Chitinophagales bacterium]
MENDKYLRALYPERGSLEDFEKWITPKIAAYKKAHKQNANRTQAVITIPVAVHVIHNGDAIGTGENISDAQVLSQIRVLNEDYRRLLGSPGYNTNPVGADVEVEFCMAQTDPSGNLTNGIDRVQRTEASWSSQTAIDGTLKPATIWPPTEYLNMWTVRFSGGLSGVLGYAQFPEASGLGGLSPLPSVANSDGVVASFDAFGSQNYAPSGTYNAPYNLGRTMTHEVGHWLGLLHIWGDGDCSVDDYCADTPNAGQANFGCPTINSCTDPAPDPNDMVQNYMDYSDDACMNIFTNDQKARIQTVLTSSPRRMELAFSDKCSAPYPAIAFASNLITVPESPDCNYQDYVFAVNISSAPSADATVTFNATGTASNGLDYTFSPSSVVFPAGSTASQNVTVRIYSDGIVESLETVVLGFTVSTSGNARATSSSYNQLAITIIDDDYAPNASSTVDNMNATFNSGADGFGTTGNTGSDRFMLGNAAAASSTNWIIQNTNTTQFAFTNDDECNCNKAADRLISPTFSLSGYTNATLSFDQAFAGATGETATLQISTNGGFTWTDLFNITNTSTDLGNGVLSTPWVNNTVNLDAYAGQSNLRIRFNYNDGGIWNYGMAIDNVRIYSVVGTQVQTQINSSNKDMQPIRSNETTYWYDPASGRVMGSIANTSAWNYNCTTMEVDRDATSVGAGAAAFWNSTPADFLIAKTFYINPADNNPSGTYSVTFYFTDAEITAWETATGKSRSNLKIIKVAGSPISDVNSGNFGSYTIETQPAVLGTFGSNYTLTADFSTGFSGFGFGDPAPPALPIELTIFNAVKSGDKAHLYWTTASEWNNDYFEIQKSSDGIHFEKIGTVDGAGNSNQPLHYNFYDSTLVVGLNYYRLKQVDFDGTFAYSKIASIDVASIVQNSLTLYPNPATTQITLQYNNTQDGSVDIQIVDAIGRIVFQEQHKLVTSGEHQFVVDTHLLSKGLYCVRLTQDANQFSQIFIKK